MSAQRRVVHSTELAGAAMPTPSGAGNVVPKHRFRCVASGFRSSASPSQRGTTVWANGSLGISSRCKWRFGHGQNRTQYAASSCMRLSRTGSSSPALWVSRAGYLPQQLPLISPLLSGAFEQEQVSAPMSQSALPQVLTSLGSRTERQHGQGNMYLQHPARNAACDFGRRSARRDLLRAGK